MKLLSGKYLSLDLQTAGPKQSIRRIGHGAATGHGNDGLS